MRVKSPALKGIENCHFVLGLLELTQAVLCVDCFQDIRQIMTHLLHFFSRGNSLLLLVPLLEQTDGQVEFEFLDLSGDLPNSVPSYLIALVHYFTQVALHFLEPIRVGHPLVTC